MIDNEFKSDKHLTNTCIKANRKKQSFGGVL